MSRPTLLTIVAVALLAATASPALADPERGASAPPNVARDLESGASAPPDAVLQEDGKLVMGGDAVIDCPSATQALERYADGPPDDPGLRAELQQARRAAELCEQAGFSSSGTASATPAPSAGASASASAPTASGEGELPSTGGRAHPTLLVVFAGVLLATSAAAGVLLARRSTTG